MQLAPAHDCFARFPCPQNLGLLLVFLQICVVAAENPNDVAGGKSGTHGHGSPSTDGQGLVESVASGASTRKSTARLSKHASSAGNTADFGMEQVYKANPPGL